MPQITDRETKQLFAFLRAIEQESNKPVQRRNKIYNYSQKCSSILRRAQRREIGKLL